MLVSEGQPVLPLCIPPPPCSRRALRERWVAASGYREVLQLAWPLFLSQGSSTILQFIDRMFLTWFSARAMAAAGPAGLMAFALQSFFVGLAGYTTVFVAQYTGAGKSRQAFAVVWQALYLSLLAALLMQFLVPVGGWVFRLAGHDPEIQVLERSFFSIFLYGSISCIGSAAICGYFIGRGESRIVLRVNLLAVVINIILDYLLIFGNLGFPRLGIAGAALASVLAQTVSLLVSFICFLYAMRESHVRGAWRIDLTLLRRLLRFGSASGVQFALDMVMWTAFLLLVGRLGVTALAATNLAFQMNSLCFFPIIGFGMAASTLVGQNLGKNRPDLANQAVWSAIHISLLFTAVIGLCFILFPRWLMLPFGAEADPAAFLPVRETTVILLRFVAAYCLFDVGNLIFAAALKGAGDTLFVMLLSTSIVASLMLVPIMLWCVTPGGLGVYGAWAFVTLAVCVLAIAFLFRFRAGHWCAMRVIEK
jgi:MATE family multidrug resistance protein